MDINFFPSFEIGALIETIIIIDSSLTLLDISRSKFPSLRHVALQNTPGLTCDNVFAIEEIEGITVEFDRSCPREHIKMSTSEAVSSFVTTTSNDQLIENSFKTSHDLTENTDFAPVSVRDNKGSTISPHAVSINPFEDTSTLNVDVTETHYLYSQTVNVHTEDSVNYNSPIDMQTISTIHVSAADPKNELETVDGFEMSTGDPETFQNKNDATTHGKTITIIVVICAIILLLLTGIIGAAVYCHIKENRTSVEPFGNSFELEPYSYTNPVYESTTV